jgi:hypothetical protein
VFLDTYCTPVFFSGSSICSCSLKVSLCTVHNQVSNRRTEHPNVMHVFPWVGLSCDQWRPVAPLREHATDVFVANWYQILLLFESTSSCMTSSLALPPSARPTTSGSVVLHRWSHRHPLPLLCPSAVVLPLITRTPKLGRHHHNRR